MLNKKESFNFDESLTRQAAEILSNKKLVTVVFTGAGISVESGIPPFRGQNGLWTKVDPKIATLDYFLFHPQEVWDFWRKYFYSPMITQARPNKAHQILAEWESKGIINAVITQNIDNLHQEAGSKNVYELHGNFTRLVCKRCYYEAQYNKKIIEEPVPMCPKCKEDILRPDMVMFGESLPEKDWKYSRNYMGRAFAVVIIGSTGEVHPAAELPYIASQKGAKIIEINPEPSAFTNSITDIYIPLGASEGLSKINQEIR